MTVHATSGVLIGLSMKSKDEFLGCCDLRVVPPGVFNGLDMRLSRAMATLAVSAIFHFLWRHLGMNRFVELIRLDRMTRGARLSAHIVARLTFSRCLPNDGRRHVCFRLLLS